MTDPGDSNAALHQFRSKLFIHKTLLSLQFLQGTTRYKQGASLRVITTYVKKHFLTDGNIKSQVLASLKEAVHHGFIQKKAGCYILIGPVANVLLTEHDSEDRRFQCKRTRKIFNLKWSNSGKRNKKCMCLSKGEVERRTTGVLCSFLKKISEIFSPQKAACNTRCNDAAILEMESDSSDLASSKETPIRHLPIRCDVVRWKAEKLRSCISRPKIMPQAAEQSSDNPVSTLTYTAPISTNKETNTETMKAKSAIVEEENETKTKKLKRTKSDGSKLGHKKKKRKKDN